MTAQVVRYPNGTAEGRNGRRNRDRSERHILVRHSCFVKAAFGWLSMSVPTAPGVQELDPIDVDEIPIVLGTRLFVVSGFRAFPAFEIDA